MITYSKNKLLINQMLTEYRKISSIARDIDNQELSSTEIRKLLKSFMILDYILFGSDR